MVLILKSYAYDVISEMSTWKPVWSGLLTVWSLFACAQMHVIKICAVYNVAH